MDNRLRPREFTQRLWAGATVITTLCSHYTTLLMALQPAPKAQWNPTETTALLDHLVDKKASGDGVSNFKDTVYNAALVSIQPLLTSGPPKTLQLCKNKWASVRYLNIAVCKTYCCISS